MNYLRSMIRSILNEPIDLSASFNEDPWIYGKGAVPQHAWMTWQVVRTDPSETGPYRTVRYHYDNEDKAQKEAVSFVAQFGEENVWGPTLTLRTGIGKVDPHMEDVPVLRARGELM